MKGRLWALAYRMQLFQIGSTTIQRTVLSLAWGVPVAILALWFLRGMPQVSLLHWLVMAFLVLVAASVTVLVVCSRREQFVDFVRQPEVRPPQPMGLDPSDKTQVHATGGFEVEGKRHQYVDLLAYWRTFSTREHAVMAILHASRLLGIARVPEDHVGMWYIFFRPEMIESIDAGSMTHGRDRRQALRIRYWRTPEAKDDRHARRAKPILETVFLSFGDDGERRRVWADLLAD